MYLIKYDRATKVAILHYAKIVCCMALNKISQPYLSKPLRLISTLMMHRAVSFYPAGPVQQSGLVKNGAGNGNRTRLSCLEGRRTSRCTTPASKGGALRGMPLEKIGT